VKICNKKLFFLQVKSKLSYVESKNDFRTKKKFRLSHGVAGGFWTNFEAQLAQPC
jgi:hypothetical protein